MVGHCLVGSYNKCYTGNVIYRRSKFPCLHFSWRITLDLRWSGIHPTITGVILGLMTPTKIWISDDRLHSIMKKIISFPPGNHWSGDTDDRKALRMAETAARESLSPVERLEIKLHPWVGFAVMPLFALANAGVPIATDSFEYSLSFAIFLGFILGKPLGVCLFSWTAVHLKIAILPNDLNWKWRFSSGHWIYYGIIYCQSRLHLTTH